MSNKFVTKYTADISDYRRNIQQVKDMTSSAWATMRGMIGATMASAGVGSFGSLIKDVTELATRLENTKIAFDVMMGSAEKGNKTLAALNQFADYTPFDNEEVIAAGRSLLNVGTASGQLTDKLTYLGNIASGVQAPLVDIVNIYAKAANKGKVQAEELAQLGERGVPILQMLAKMLNMTTAEVMDLGSKGKLSFALLDEAMQKMGGSSGQYAGLMEKLSMATQGKMDGIKISVRNMAQQIGEKSLPALSQACDDIIQKIEEMKASGEYDKKVEEISGVIRDLIANLMELGSALIKITPYLISLGKVALAYVAWQKFNLALTTYAQISRHLNNAGGIIASLKQQIPLLKAANADVKCLTRAIGAGRAALTAFGAAAATAFAGYEVGKMLAKVMNLEKHFTSLLLKMQGLDPNIGEEVAKKPKASVASRDLVQDKKRKTELASEIADLQKELATLTASGKTEEASPIAAQIEKLKKEESELTAATAKYQEKAKSDIEKIAKAKAEFEDAYKAQQKAEAAANAPKSQKPKYEPMPGMDANTAAVYTLHNPPADKTSGLSVEEARARTLAAEAKLRSFEKTREEYNEAMKKLAEAEAADALTGAKKISEAERIKAAAAEEQTEKRIAAEAKLAEERKAIAEAQKKLNDTVWKDAMSERIENWKKQISGYQKAIDATSDKLSKLGYSADENLLKTPQQIAEKRRDDMLKRKIEAANSGEKVNFSAGELARIAEIQNMQKAVRTRKNQISGTEAQISGIEGQIASKELAQKKADIDTRRLEIANRDKALNSVDLQLKAAKAANAPLEKILADVLTVLSKRLPTA